MGEKTDASAQYLQQCSCLQASSTASGRSFRGIEVICCAFRIFCAIIIKVKVVSGGEIMSKHIVTINSSSLQDSIKFEGCSECQTSCQSACKTSCTIGNLLCTEQEEAEEA